MSHGDGEAETGPPATSRHANKFVDPIRDGAVLPILHLNGYKIANPTPPDVVLASAGDVPALEALAAAEFLRVHVPDLRVRFVEALGKRFVQAVVPCNGIRRLADRR